MTRMVTVGSVELCTDSFGSPEDPAILLLAGNGSSMDWWEEDFCAGLAAGGRFVIRYDHRDTGQSTSYPAGSPGYGGGDLVADAVAVLDGYGLAAACVGGISMGGALAQLVALDFPDRVRSLALLSTTAAGGPAELPPVADRLAAYLAAAPEVDGSDRTAAVESLVGYSRALAAESEPFDSAGTRALVERALARTRDVPASLVNHDRLSGGDPWWDRLGRIAVPTLVVHGEEDPLFPPAHGAALAAAIPNATLHLLPGVGHELPRRAWPQVLPELLRISP